MSWTDDLLGGIASVIAELGVGSYDPTGDTGNITLGAVDDEPDNAIGLQPYNLQADPAMADVTQPVQIWVRGDQAWVKATADAIFDGLHGAINQTFGGVACPLVYLYSDVPQGIDQRGRTQRALNYYVQAMRPTASRPD